MESKDYLAYLVEEIHTTVVATVDDAGLPVTAAIDMMDADEGGVYFLTARGKGFYDRLKKRGVLALTGMKGEDTMHCAALSIRGKVRELESDAYLTYVTQVGDCVVTEYISAQGQRYGLLLDGQCRTLADLPELCDILADGTLVFDDMRGNLRQSRIYSLQELLALAQQP